MTIEVRACRPEEVARGLRPIFHFFGSTPSEDALTMFDRLMHPGRLHPAFEGGDAVGGAGVFPLELTVPGGRVQAAGVTVVGALPSHRLRGILRELMRAQLDECTNAARRSPACGRPRPRSAAASATEWPRSPARSTWRATARGTRSPSSRAAVSDWSIATRRSSSSRPSTSASPARRRGWSRGAGTGGSCARGRGGGEMVRAVLEVDGDPQAYALYRLHPAFEHFASVGRTNVIEALAVSPEATAEIWRFLFDVDWMSRIEARLLPIDHPLFFLLVEPRLMRFMLTDALWVRIVDIGDALSRRSYLGDSEVVLDVEDAFCPWNEGRWSVTSAGSERTDAAADLRLDVSALGSVYLGGFTFAGARARRARGGAAAPGRSSAPTSSSAATARPGASRSSRLPRCGGAWRRS